MFECFGQEAECWHPASLAAAAESSGASVEAKHAKLKEEFIGEGTSTGNTRKGTVDSKCQPPLAHTHTHLLTL